MSSIEDNRIGLGVIGCGGHSLYHLENLGKSFDFRIGWDPDKKRLEKLPTGTGVDFLDELLESKIIEAVLIGSPDEFHLEQIAKVLDAGKHVFCEKPLIVPGQSLVKLEDLFGLAKRKGLVLTSCHPRRFDRPFLWFIKNQESFIQRFGDSVGMSFDFSYHVPGEDWKHDRSLLLDHVNHEVDLMNALFGIKGFQVWKLHDGHDRYEVAGKRDDGITFHFRGTRKLKSKAYPEWCRIRYERGEVNIDMLMGLAYIIDHEEKKTETIPDLAIDYKGRLLRVMDNFAGQIRGESDGYLTRSEMIINNEAGIVLQGDGIQRINIRS